MMYTWEIDRSSNGRCPEKRINGTDEERKEGRILSTDGHTEEKNYSRWLVGLL